MQIVFVEANRAMIPALMELDGREWPLGEEWSKWQWHGLVDLQSSGDSRVTVAAEPVGPQQLRVVGFAAWTHELRSTPKAGETVQSPLYRLQKFAVCRSYRGERIGTDLANAPWMQSRDCVADVHESKLVVQQFLRGAGWRGLPLTRLDGDGWIRFTATVEARPDEPQPSEPRAKRKTKKRKPKPPPAAAAVPAK